MSKVETATTAPVIRTKLIVGVEGLNKAIADIQRVGKKLDTMIQVAGMSCMAHVEDHKDITPLVSLWHAMPKGSRKKALMDWVLKYGRVLPNADEKGKIDEEKPFLFDRKGRTDLLGAEAEPWFNCAPEKLDAPLDFLKLLDALLKKADKAGDGVGFTDPAQAAAVKAITEARHSIALAPATAVEA